MATDKKILTTSFGIPVAEGLGLDVEEVRRLAAMSVGERAKATAI